MDSIPPESAAPAKRRPLYLVAALVVSFLMGAAGCSQGYGGIGAYRTDPVLIPGALDGASEARRAAVEQALAHLISVMDATKRTGLPLTIAGFLIGFAMMTLTISAFMRRTGSPRLLAQMVFAQAVLVVVTFFAQPEVRWAERDLVRAQQLARTEATAKTDEERRQVVEAEQLLVKALPPALAVALVLRTALAGLVVLALTRRRTREYYDDARAPISER